MLSGVSKEECRGRGMWSASRNNIDLLPKFGNRAFIQNTVPMGSGINHRVASDDRAGTDDCVATDFGAVADDGSEFSQSGGSGDVGGADDDFAAVESDI